MPFLNPNPTCCDTEPPSIHHLATLWLIGRQGAQIDLLYLSLLRQEPTPVGRLSQAVALCEAGWLEPAMRSLEALAGELRDYQPYHAARAELLSRMGQADEAAKAYAIAIALAATPSDAAFLRQRAKRLGEQS